MILKKASQEKLFTVWMMHNTLLWFKTILKYLQVNMNFSGSRNLAYNTVHQLRFTFSKVTLWHIVKDLRKMDKWSSRYDIRPMRCKASDVY
jgi:chloramphenicol O-acetyltransferase